MSEGDFVDMRPQRSAVLGAKTDESTDTFDTIEWLVNHAPLAGGRVGMWGISYPGFYTTAGLVEAHPALKASSPQAPILDWFIGDDWHHNGALMLPHAFNFMATFGRPRPAPTTKFNPTFDHDNVDGYDFFLQMGPIAQANAVYFKNDVPFWNEVMKHGMYDEFWKSRTLRPQLQRIRPAVMTVGGWFDAENLYGALETYRAIEKNGPNTSNTLVMGPWSHGGWSRSDGESLGPLKFNAKTAVFFREQIELPFFEFYLKGKGQQPATEAWVFQTGTEQWLQLPAWPPPVESRGLYFRAGGKLAYQPPPDDDDGDTFDEYTSDPAKPVPYLEKITIGMTPDYMTEDQRFAGRRTDVLVYEGDVLQDDLAIAGPIQVELQVSTTGTDSDWIVKLIDVYPNDYPDPNPNPTGRRMGGFQQMVRGDVMRGKFRQGFDRPQPFAPSQPATVSFRLPDVCHVFRTGHRLLVQVQSTWFPLIDRNPQTFVDIYTAKPEDFIKAKQRVYRSTERASRLILPVVKPAS
jgi:putative CocE/NonD family hydrolase